MLSRRECIEFITLLYASINTRVASIVFVLENVIPILVGSAQDIPENQMRESVD